MGNQRYTCSGYSITTKEYMEKSGQTSRRELGLTLSMRRKSAGGNSAHSWANYCEYPLDFHSSRHQRVIKLLLLSIGLFEMRLAGKVP